VGEVTADRRLAAAAAVTAALLTAVVAVGCATATGSRDAALPGPAVSLDVDHLEQRALLLLLADRQTYEPVTIDAALDASPELRRQAALTLGRLADARGGPVLASLLADADAAVRRAAAFALGELGEDLRARPAAAEEGYVEAAAAALLGTVNDPDRDSGRLAVEALAKLGVTVETVAERLIEGPSEELLPRLLPSLFRFQSREDPSAGVVRWAAAGLAEDDGERRRQAAYALARTPLPESAPALRPLLADGDAEVRGWAARALGEVGERPDLDLLRPLLDDPAPGPIVQALRAARRLIAAGTAAPPSHWQPRLLELLDEARPGVRLTAVEAAGSWLLDDELGEALVTLAAAGHPRERQLALLALAEGEDPRAVIALAAAARDADVAVRRNAARAAGLLSAVEVLEQLAADEHPAVRAAVLETWLAADPDDAAARAAEGLADADAGVRATAFEWLAEHPVVPLELLVEALAASLRDRIPDSRLAGVDALAARAAAEPLERGALIAELETLARDEAYLVRSRASAALAGLGREAPEPGALRLRKPVEVYRDVVRRTARPRRATIRTERGDVVVELACPEAPLTCLNFLQLGAQGFYDGLPFHRVVPDFVVQAGDPRGDGRGGPGYQIRDEINVLRYEPGVLGMALAGPDTGGSQFFLTLAPQPHLDGGYTVFGRVVAGLEVLDQVVQGDRILGVVEEP
jgi:cyclophilin family peptidyl-prolyl cis-trans isomerase